MFILALRELCIFATIMATVLYERYLPHASYGEIIQKVGYRLTICSGYVLLSHFPSGFLSCNPCHVLVGFQSSAMSIEEAAAFMLRNLHVARYWQRKVGNADFHPGDTPSAFHFNTCLTDVPCSDTWGGARHYRFSENTRFLLHFAIYCRTLESPQITALEVSVHLNSVYVASSHGRVFTDVSLFTRDFSV